MALAILADHCGNDEDALNYYQRFKWKVIAVLPGRWTLTAEGIDRVLQTLRLPEGVT